jgi:hypothetical protein
LCRCRWKIPTSKKKCMKKQFSIVSIESNLKWFSEKKSDSKVFSVLKFEKFNKLVNFWAKNLYLVFVVIQFLWTGKQYSNVGTV